GDTHGIHVRLRHEIAEPVKAESGLVHHIGREYVRLAESTASAAIELLAIYAGPGGVAVAVGDSRIWGGSERRLVKEAEASEQQVFLTEVLIHADVKRIRTVGGARVGDVVIEDAGGVGRR